MKGIINLLLDVNIASVITALLIMGTMFTLANSAQQNKARLETVPVVENRIESTVYGTSGVERAKVEMKFTDSYEILTIGDEKWVIYEIEQPYSTLIDSRSRRRLEVPVQSFETENGTSKIMCVRKKTGSVKLETEGC